MRLKNILTYGNWCFYIGQGEEEIRVPLKGFIRTRKQAIASVIATLNSLEKQGAPEYKARVTEEANAMKENFATFVGYLIEHQICLRAGGLKSGICQSSGIGDTLHSFVEKVDDAAEKLPSPLKKLYAATMEKVTKKLNPTEKPKRRASGCSSCGGTRSLSKSTWNMGRAGRLQ